MLPFIQEWCDEFMLMLTNTALYTYGTLSHSVDDLQSGWSDSLQERMTRYIKQHNGKKCHFFKPHIISLKSKNLLSHINHLTNLDDKLESLRKFNAVLERVCTSLYAKFDPHMMYAFNNEIHLVFYHNDDGNFLYDGDIMKTVTKIVSYASIVLAKELKESDLAWNVDCVFEGNFVEFSKEYEALNYIVWRQLDCKRNNITLLYKCINYEGILDNMVSLDKVRLTELQKGVSDKVAYDTLETLVYGQVLKKQIIYIETDAKSVCWKEGEQLHEEDKNELVTRKMMCVKHIPLWVNFKSNLHKYVINKFL